METENIINLGVTREEAEELCYVIDEQEGAFYNKYRESSDPWKRKYWHDRYELAHHLRIRLEQILDEHPVPPIVVPSFDLNDMLAMAFPTLYRVNADIEPHGEENQNGG